MADQLESPQQMEMDIHGLKETVKANKGFIDMNITRLDDRITQQFVQVQRESRNLSIMCDDSKADIIEQNQTLASKLQEAQSQINALRAETNEQSERIRLLEQEVREDTSTEQESQTRGSYVATSSRTSRRPRRRRVFYGLDEDEDDSGLGVEG